MNKATIAYVKKTRLIANLLKKENIISVKKQSLMQKFGFRNKEEIDLYFHSGILNVQALDNIRNAKRVIVGSDYAFEKLSKKISKKELEKVKIIYPSIDINCENESVIKNKVYSILNLDKNKKIIFFTAKDFKKAGVKEFLSIVETLSSEKFVVLIHGERKEVEPLLQRISKSRIKDRIILNCDYENIDELFIASDIFILPTFTKTFATNILKALYCRNIVFATKMNSASILLDNYSLMDNSDDKSIIFKIEALFKENSEIEQIKDDNRKVANAHTLCNNLKRIEKLLESESNVD